MRVGARVSSVIALLGATLSPLAAFAFTQSSPVSPVGHEELTVRGARAASSSLAPETSEIGADQGCPAYSCDTYGTTSLKVYSAVIGQRWVDIMGFLKLQQSKCFDAVAQDNDDVQFDHFLKRDRDANADGAKAAFAGSVARFKQLFVEASSAGDEAISVLDGGATQRTYRVSKAYFLFGKALHLLEDSFSTEHAIRLRPDGHQVGDILSYSTTPGSRYHSHGTPSFLSVDVNGDIIWDGMASQASGGRTPNATLKENARWAVEAVKDLWLAFERAHGSRASTVPGRCDARCEADAFAMRWFAQSAGFGNPVAAVDNQPRTTAPSNLTPRTIIDAWRSQCLAKVGAEVELGTTTTGTTASTTVASWSRPRYSWSAVFSDADISGGDKLVSARTGMERVGDLIALESYFWTVLSASFAWFETTLDDALLTVTHLAEGTKCNSGHAATYSTTTARSAMALADTKLDELLGQLALALQSTPAAERYGLANPIVSAFRQSVESDPVTGLRTLATRRSAYVRDWYLLPSHKDAAESAAKAAWNAEISAFESTIDRKLKAQFPPPPAPPPPFFALGPTSEPSVTDGQEVVLELSRAANLAPLPAGWGTLSGSGTRYRYVAPARVTERRTVTLFALPADGAVNQAVSVPVHLLTKLHMRHRFAPSAAWVSGCPNRLALGQSVTFGVEEPTTVTFGPLPADESSVSGNQLTVTGVDHSEVHFYPVNGAAPPPDRAPRMTVVASAADDRIDSCSFDVPGRITSRTDSSTANVRVTANGKVVVRMMGYEHQASDPRPDWSVPREGSMGATAAERGRAEAELGALRTLQGASESTNKSATTRAVAVLEGRTKSDATLGPGALKALDGGASKAGPGSGSRLAADKAASRAPILAASLAFLGRAQSTFRAPAKATVVEMRGSATDGSGRSAVVRIEVR